jgi:hypothetical protein
MASTTTTSPLSRFLTFDRDAWARLRDNTPLTLSEADLDALRGLNDSCRWTRWCRSTCRCRAC